MRFTFHLAAAMAATLTATAVAAAQTGNGAPSGPHYNLNIIGVSHDKNPNMNGNGSGNVIFVDLGTKSGVAVTTKILLSQSADGVFQVRGRVHKPRECIQVRCACVLGVHFRHRVRRDDRLDAPCHHCHCRLFVAEKWRHRKEP